MSVPRYLLLVWLCCFHVLAQASSTLPGGVVIIKTRIDQADEFAQAIPFLNFESHPVTSNFHLGNVHPYIVKNQLIVALLDFKKGPYVDHLLHEHQVADLDREMTKLREVVKRHPQTRAHLQGPYQALINARERLLGGQVRIHTRWQLKSEYESELRQKREVAEATQRRLNEVAQDKAQRDYHFRSRLEHGAGSHLLHQHRESGSAWVRSSNALTGLDQIPTQGMKKLPLPMIETVEPVLWLGEGEESFALLHYVDEEKQTRSVQIATTLKWAEGQLRNKEALPEWLRLIRLMDAELATWLPIGLTGCYTQQQLNRERGRAPTITRTKRAMGTRHYELALTAPRVNPDGSLVSVVTIKIF